MPDVEDDNDEALLIDLVENAPLPGEASTVDAGELFAERSAHALRIREQWPCDQSMAATATLCGSSSASARPDAVHVVIASDYASVGCGGGCGIRTREGVNPTRFPSRPAGVSGRSIRWRAPGRSVTVSWARQAQAANGQE
jgi:hypothetical protein